MRNDSTMHDDDTMHDDETRWRRRCEGLLGVPATEGNELSLLRNGDEIFRAMLAAIRAAERSVDLLTYVYWSGDVADRFADALVERARAGVRVRVLLDGVGARSVEHVLVERMRDAGCDVRFFRPVDAEHATEANHRTHRKVLVCDEVVAFTGGVGIADEWRGDARSPDEWRDTHVRIDGPAVDGLRAAFVDNWVETGAVPFHTEYDVFPDHERPGRSTVQVVRGAAEVGQSDVATLFELLLGAAKRRVRITTAYFNPTDELLELLVETADRGVDISVMVPGPHHDKRFVQMASEATFDRLLESSIRIVAFQPTMLHAKTVTVDGTVATIGSANLNTRSMSHDEEVELVVFDAEVAAQLDRHFDDDLQRCERIDPSRWSDRSVVQRIAERAADTVSDLF